MVVGGAGGSDQADANTDDLVFVTSLIPSLQMPVHSNKCVDAFSPMIGIATWWKSVNVVHTLV